MRMWLPGCLGKSELLELAASDNSKESLIDNMNT